MSADDDYGFDDFLSCFLLTCNWRFLFPFFRYNFFSEPLALLKLESQLEDYTVFWWVRDMFWNFSREVTSSLKPDFH